MTDFVDFQTEDLAFDAMWDGYEDQSDWEWHMQFDDREQDGWSERYDYPDEVDDFVNEFDDMAGEDDYLDSYWESMSEPAFFGGE